MGGVVARADSTVRHLLGGDTQGCIADDGGQLTAANQCKTRR